MPLYEYECTACHRRTEKIQKFSDPEITVCPFCAGPLQRVLSAPAFSLKGGGWYADGYGSKKPASGDAASTPAAAATASSDSSAPAPAAAASTAAPSTPAASTGGDKK